MNNLIIKNILLENNINKIAITNKLYTQPLYVVDCVFDTQSRSKIYFYVSKTTKPRTNKIKTILSYLIDFNDQHVIHIVNIDKNNAVYQLLDNYTVSDNTLYLNSL